MPLSWVICLILVLVDLLGGVRGEVGNFSPCLHFFYKGSPPKGLGSGPGWSKICQRYKNQYRFASLYRSQWRSPLYSAYIFTPGGMKRPPTQWKYEPQLASSSASPNMKPFPPEVLDQNVLDSQAVLPDYTNSSYTKGHLSPNLHHRDLLDKKATFTLTNVVPQKAGSNGGPWAQLEALVRARLTDYCTGPAFVVTGQLPYAQPTSINNRVAVPEYLWSAYCCPTYNHSLPGGLQETFPTFAAMGRNDPLSSQEIVPVNSSARATVRGYDVRSMPLKILEKYLEQRLGEPVHVFSECCSGAGD
ncbi:ENDD1 protein, partial [Amia calva]|nr:ENDD1 protein [Amia calva]